MRIFSLTWIIVEEAIEEELIKLLKEYNIPYTCKYSEKIFERIEVKIILAYLKILNNFCDEVCLCSVLKNIYNFTDENLVKIKKTNLCDDVLNYKENDEILIKIQEFFTNFGVEFNLSIRRYSC